MKYGQISESKGMNAAIYQCFAFLSEREARKFVREFGEQPHEQIQVMHTFRELILGAYLAKQGFAVEHNFRVETKTPDWCILDASSQPVCLVELVNFHPDAETSADMVRQLRERGRWVGFLKPNTERLYRSIDRKALTYKAIATQHRLAYLVAVFGDFNADVEEREIHECLFHPKDGIFQRYPELSGLIYFLESAGDYHFSFWPNQLSAFRFDLPSGVFESSLVKRPWHKPTSND